MKFSANLGFLWTELTLPDAIRAAKAADFDAVECHWPYEVSAQDIKSALEETGLKMLGLNTIRGNVEKGEFGLAALTGREVDARKAIDQSIKYAAAIDCKNIHVMAGNASGSAAHETFIENLRYACLHAKNDGMTILIEPLNKHDAPDYFLKDTRQAAEIIKQVASENLRLMFDCYHVGRTQGDVVSCLRDMISIIGHIQFAAVPNRGTPDHGDVDYDAIFNLISELGYNKPLGAEYRPPQSTEDSLAWLERYKRL